MSSSLLLMLGGASALAKPASVGPDSLYVVGCGVMGQSVCLQWRAAYPDATIIGETGSDASHERLRAIGVEPVLRSARDGRACDHVLFCAPPSPFGDDEYGEEGESDLVTDEDFSNHYPSQIHSMDNNERNSS